MKVKALIDCVGIGYALKKGDTAELETKLADILVKFAYVEEIKEKKPSASKVKK